MSHPVVASRVAYCLVFLCLIVAAGCREPVSDDPDILARLPEVVDFNYHIRPLLSDRCFKCHGPDENTREAGLRLDIESAALAELPENPGHVAIKPGSLRRSAVAQRIVSTDPEVQMPPPESNLSLSSYEVALLRRWIQQGAEWKPHWAFTPVGHPEPPPVRDAGWPASPIDAFILARLERDGIAPAPEADRERLLRRVTMDLTGLPPTLEEMDAFLSDGAPDAYERVVDRLLASPAYAERMAVEWMDLARYADSHGYHADGYRLMWPWRDWVIQAFDENMPYDRFVTVQLAGDLLPNASREQILATAFNRNHQMTAEGGIVDEEYRMEYVADRTNTFAEAFLGLTMECARCHDHKFDPVTQKEYYQLAAFFNNVKEVGMTGDDGNAGPMLMLYPDSVQTALATVRDSIAAVERKLAARLAQVEAQPDRWRGAQPPAEPAGLVDHYPLERIADGQTPNLKTPSRPASASGDIELVEGPRGKAARLDYDFDYVELKGAGLYDRYEPFSVGIWVYPEKKEEYAELFGNAGQKNSYWRGYEVYLDSLNRVNVRLINALPHNYIHVRTRDGIAGDAWTHVMLTYDGSSKAAGVRLFLDGAPVALDAPYDRLYKSMYPVETRYERWDRPMRVGKSYRAFSGNDGIFTGRIDDIRVYNRALTGIEVERLVGQKSLSDAERAREELAYVLASQDEPYRRLSERLKTLRMAEFDLIEPVMEVMVMEEMPEIRETHILNRGQYDQPRDRVDPGTPAAVLSFPDTLPRNRLGLAQWLFAPENPLTARVAVNRFWQMYFGRGLVATPGDFGFQGMLPSHPALLDWLAAEFVASGWDVKALQKRIVMSATYRQASQPREGLREVDPENVLLARGPSYRFSAEMIRDNALAASGLLVRKVGGPSAKPYQPEGLWIEKGTFSPMLLRYIPDKGEGLYRRSLYTFVKRTSPPPSMIAFDATDRSSCVIQRQRTNTPLQALILLNDPQYVEASRVLAERMQREAGDTLDSRLGLGFRLLTGRHPIDQEIGVLRELYETEKARFASRPDEARALLAVGDFPRDESLDLSETAALTIVANTMINHDEAYMKR
ncbi:MAG: DUF1553 domain-containing protein [Rhodothermales bacterium]